MSTLTITAERITAAGCSRAIASVDASVVEYAGAAAFAVAADFRGWGANPTSGMQVKAIKAHHLTPAPRPEEAFP